MTIREELDKLRTYGEEFTPSNEAETCHWVIVPLLEACGYARYEIRTQNPDGAGRFPDFTILGNIEHKWFLEAKAWRERLSDDHINQAIYSAFSTGQRWVVLSNGREWRLYDARIHGNKPSDRLVFTAHLNNGSAMEELLSALCKDSITSKKIEKFAETARLRSVLDQQLSDASSHLLKKMADVLKRELNVPNATPAAVKEVLGLIHEAAATTPAQDTQENSTAPATYEPPVPAAPLRVQTPVKPAPGEPMYLLTPVRDEPGCKVRELLETLLGTGWYVFGDGTTGRKALKPGDKIAFYHTGVGVVAEAEVETYPELGEVPGVKNPKDYPWRFRVKNVRYFFEVPIRLKNQEFRAKLDAFRGREGMQNWSWFVQGTGKVTRRDFEILPGRRSE